MDYRSPGSPVHGFPRQEYWSGLWFSSAGYLLHPEIKPPPPAWQADSFPLSSVQFSSVAQSCPILCDPMDCSINSRSLPKLMSTESVMLSNYLILCRPLLLPPSIFPSIRVFSNEFVLRIRWPKYWSFSFNISPSNENSGLIFFRMDWLALLEVQETLKSLLQHHSSKALILWCSAFFIVQLSNPYMTTGKIIAPLSYPSLNIP